jgi:hypothetical protein
MMRGVSYWLTRTVKNSAVGPDVSKVAEAKTLLYLAVTNDAIGTPLLRTLGAGFSMPPTIGYGLAAYEPLVGDEPTAQQLAAVVDDGFSRGFIRVGSMESDPVTFAGLGDPLSRLSVLEDAARLIKYAAITCADDASGKHADAWAPTICLIPLHNCAAQRCTTHHLS